MTKYTKPWLGLLLVCAMAFHTLVPFFADYTHSNSKSSSVAGITATMKLASVFGEKILICTASGFVFVNLKDLLAGKVPLKKHATSLLCALCYMAASPLGKLLLFSAALFLLTRHFSKSLSLLFLYSRQLKHYSLRASHPRAPPVFFC